MGRLKPGWTLERASGYLYSLSPGLFAKTAPDGYSSEELKAFKEFRLAAYAAGAGVSYLRDQYNSSLEILLAITGLVLLIACANLANLMLARASVKNREIAIRMALGASRGRILRQSLLESALLATCGALLGAGVAQPLSRILVRSLDTSGNTIQLAIMADWRVLLFAAAAAISTCLIFGTLPALRSTAAEPVASLKTGERGVAGNRERFSVQRAMVITQIAVSMVLLAGALLFVRSYRNLMTINPGIRESGITVGYFGFPSMHIKAENLAAYKRQIEDDVRAIPGIENAAATTIVPFSGASWGHTIEVGSLDGPSRFTYVSPSFFSTLGIPLLTGRNFTEGDTNDNPLVLIVNQAFLRKYVSAPSTLGVQVRVRPEPQYPARTYQIVGTIPDTKYSDLREDPPAQAFVPIAQLPVTAQGPGMGMLFAFTRSRSGGSGGAAYAGPTTSRNPNAVPRFPAGHPRPTGRRSHDGQAVWFLRSSRGCARGGWTARSPLLLSCQAAQRNRHSHGSGSESRPGRRGHAAQCLSHVGSWLSRRNLARPPRHPRGQYIALWSEAVGPGDSRWRRCAFGSGHHDGQPGSINARSKGESDRVSPC
jgi:predicted permease